MLKLKKNKKISNRQKKITKRKRYLKYRRFLYFNWKKKRKRLLRFFWCFRRYKKNLIFCKKLLTIVNVWTQQNNVFSVFSKLVRGKRLVKKNLTSQSFKIKITKKRFFFNIIVFFKKLIQKMKSRLRKKKVLLFLQVPKRLQKKLLRLWFLKRRHFKMCLKIILKQAKPFNGCRAKKIRRKKYIRFKALKK